jgi:hypothetical protein
MDFGRAFDRECNLLSLNSVRVTSGGRFLKRIDTARVVMQSNDQSSARRRRRQRRASRLGDSLNRGVTAMWVPQSDGSSRSYLE